MTRTVGGLSDSACSAASHNELVVDRVHVGRHLVELREDCSLSIHQYGYLVGVVLTLGRADLI